MPGPNPTQTISPYHVYSSNSDYKGRIPSSPGTQKQTLKLYLAPAAANSFPVFVHAAVRAPGIIQQHTQHPTLNPAQLSLLLYKARSTHKNEFMYYVVNKVAQKYMLFLRSFRQTLNSAKYTAVINKYLNGEL